MYNFINRPVEEIRNLSSNSIKLRELCQKYIFLEGVIMLRRTAKKLVEVSTDITGNSENPWFTSLLGKLKE
jgi:hypothetical protein